jgi:hypothetical protein
MSQSFQKILSLQWVIFDLAACILAIRILAICGTEECILATVDITDLLYYSTTYILLLVHT